MFAIAVEATWLARIGAEDRSAVSQALAEATRTRSVIVLGSGDDSRSLAAEIGARVRAFPSLPAAKPGLRWIIVGDAPCPPPGAIALVIGRERREKGIAWASSPSAVARLCAIGSGSGMEMALANFTAAQHEAALRARFKARFDALARRKAAYVFGARRLGTVVGMGLRAKGYSVAAYLDNNTSAWGVHDDGGAICGVDHTLDRDLPVIIGTTRFPYTLEQQLDDAGFRFVLPYPAMTLLDPDLFPTEIPYVNTSQDIVAHPASEASDPAYASLVDGLVNRVHLGNSEVEGATIVPCVFAARHGTSGSMRCRPVVCRH
jgi:hypothetical protein